MLGTNSACFSLFLAFFSILSVCCIVFFVADCSLALLSTTEKFLMSVLVSVDCISNQLHFKGGLVLSIVRSFLLKTTTNDSTVLAFIFDEDPQFLCAEIKYSLHLTNEGLSELLSVCLWGTFTSR